MPTQTESHSLFTCVSLLCLSGSLSKVSAYMRTVAPIPPPLPLIRNTRRAASVKMILKPYNETNQCFPCSINLLGYKCPPQITRDRKIKLNNCCHTVTTASTSIHILCLSKHFLNIFFYTCLINYSNGNINLLVSD